MTKTKHPWINGDGEKPQTLVDEFYAVAFRKKRYECTEELQLDLDNVMDSYHYRRTQQGYNLKKNGFSKLAEAHFSEELTLIGTVLV